MFIEVELVNFSLASVERVQRCWRWRICPNLECGGIYKYRDSSLSQRWWRQFLIVIVRSTKWIDEDGFLQTHFNPFHILVLLPHANHIIDESTIERHTRSLWIWTRAPPLVNILSQSWHLWQTIFAPTHVTRLTLQQWQHKELIH
jgi:hypothetical protein